MGELIGSEDMYVDLLVTLELWNTCYVLENICIFIKIVPYHSLLIA